MSGSGAPARVVFPPGFLWGAATAAHQVEGGNRHSDWWACEEAGRLPHRSGAACRHFELYERDFDLARAWHHNAHRFSIEWARVEPQPGRFDEAALEHYAAVLQALATRGMEPVVTLYHFTLPDWFARAGGWLRADSARLFARYVEVVARRLARVVRWWLTVNEPTVYVKRAYLSGDWPPCRPGPARARRVLTSLCQAHLAAYAVLHRARADVQVGFAHSAPFIEPCDPRRYLDRLAARWRDYVLNRWCFALLGRPVNAALDFIGINYYTRQIARWTPKGLGFLFGAECRADHHGGSREFNSLGWEIFAPGLRATLARFARFGVPLLVTENGIATEDEALRERFLLAHLRALAAAVADGVDVRGYFYWSLMDNFEWTEGFGARFGLAAVDFTTQARLPRRTAQRYGEICRANAVDM